MTNLIDSIKNKKYDYIELCHRLDKGTSGCLILAKNQEFLKQFNKLNAEKKLIKEYHAIVKGTFKEKITLQTKNTLKKYNNKINDTNKLSKTTIELIKKYINCSLIKIRPYTGRLHQIRIHLTHIGHPILLDTKYGNRTFNKNMKPFLNRIFLHANCIKFKCPITNKYFKIQTCYDNFLQNFIKNIEAN